MKRVFTSLGARLVAATIALVTLVIAAIVLLWVRSATQQVRHLKAEEARAIAVVLAGSSHNELIDQNWMQIRVLLDEVVASNPELVYVLVSDDAQHGRIVAAHPVSLQDHYVSDLVPLAVSEAAQREGKPRTRETFLLRDVGEREGTVNVRAHRGEPVIEVATDIRVLDRAARNGVLRVGLSLRQLDAVLDGIVRDALIAAGALLGVALLGAWLVARRISVPVQSLETSARRMAGGELSHRANITRGDEIGSLARTFNEMAGALETSFGKLEATLASFERFVPRKFLAVVAPEGIEKIRVGERATRTITILFSDIRGYTSISEQSTPVEMFELLNDYLGRMGREIDAHGGFIDKYIGDAIMALFDDEAPDAALDAVLAMRRSLAEYNAEREAKGLPRIDTGIGLHRGEVVMGTVGYASRIDSTVIGDAVNLASRVEGLTKGYDTPVLVTEDVVRALRDPGRFALRLIDPAAKVKGKDTPVALYAVG